MGSSKLRPDPRVALMGVFNPSEREAFFRIADALEDIAHKLTPANTCQPVGPGIEPDINPAVMAWANEPGWLPLWDENRKNLVGRIRK